MKCPKCKRQFRVGQEQIGVNEQNMPILKTFCYCDYCRMKYDYEATLKTQPKKDSAMSVVAAILAFLGCTSLLGFIIALVDLIINEKDKRHLGSWVAMVFCAMWLFVAFVMGGSDKAEENVVAPTTSEVIETSIEVEQSEIIVEETTSSEKVSEVEIVEVPAKTEEEYKELCQEMYHDDFFSEKPLVKVGDYVRFNGFISGKATYYYSDTFAMVIDDIDEIYNFRKEYMGSCVMHEETKDDSLPSYFGESVYLMFPENSELNIDNYEAGQHCIIYGEIVQTWSGIFIIPKYIEIQ